MSIDGGMTVVPFRRLYDAQRFDAGEFAASGTLCGCIDVVGPFRGTLTLTPDEVAGLIRILRAARSDVLANSDPRSDPRLYDRSAE